MVKYKRCTHRACKRRGELLPDRAFDASSKNASGLTNWCRDCRLTRARQRRQLAIGAPTERRCAGTPKRLMDAGMAKVRKDMEKFWGEEEGRRAAPGKRR